MDNKAKCPYGNIESNIENELLGTEVIRIPMKIDSPQF